MERRKADKGTLINTYSKGKMAVSMLIFSTIGIFVKNISISSGLLALTRGLLGTGFLVLLTCFTKRPIGWAAIRRNRWLLGLSGTAIGINWILLFEAYRHTTVAAATLSYYLAPVFVMLLSPLVLKERLTFKQLVCIIAALSGMVLVSGVLRDGGTGIRLSGILFGMGAAGFYAAVILLNKFLREISSDDTTIIQLGTAALVLFPYVAIFEGVRISAFSGNSLWLLLVVGIVHTGAAYWLYFSSMQGLNGQTIAIFSYIDPAAAVVLSLVVLREPLHRSGVMGALLILGAAILSELNLNNKIDSSV